MEQATPKVPEDFIPMYQPREAYSYRLPSPPPTVVPPPNINHDRHPISLIPHPSYAAQGGSENLQFLSTVTDGDFVIADGVMDWKYEWRRNAQKVLPFLYLGPGSALRDGTFLKEEGITMLLAVRDIKSAQAKFLDGGKVAEEMGIHHDTVDVSGQQELIAAFPKAVQTINRHLSYMHDTDSSRGGRCRGKVLVFCETGNERSAAVVLAYIMAMYDMDLIKAIQVVQAQRFCVALDDNMKHLLQSYAMNLQAMRDVARATKQVAILPAEQTTATARENEDPGVRGGLRSGKRTLDEVYDMDIEMGNPGEDLDDRERFLSREGSAPFHEELHRSS